MIHHKYPFARYAQKVKLEISRLESLRLPKPLVWQIDWKTLKSRDNGQLKARHFYGKIDLFNQLESMKGLPAIYCFTIDPKSGEEIYKAYCKLKSISSGIKRSNGVQAPDFKSICHVPRTFQSSAHLYVGSVKNGINRRLREHLGYEKSGRTGALYLKQLSTYFPKLPVITFTVYVFEKEYVKLTEHIELVFQESYRPILGKRSLKMII